jgi:hypothetical protein
MLRRRRLPEELEPCRDAFEEVLRQVEPAMESLAHCMPTTRMPGRPLPDALADYEDHLSRSAGLMAAWRRAEVETVWLACEEGIQTGLERARRLREEAPDVVGFESMLGTVESLMDPLEPFEAAGERFRELRVARR